MAAGHDPVAQGGQERFELVICYDVMQYLTTAQARQAIAKLGQVCRGVLYFGALTSGDWRNNCDQTRTDRVPGNSLGHLVPARAEQGLSPAGVRSVAEARRAGHALGSGPGQPMIKLLLVLLKFAKFGPALKSAAFMLVSVGAYALLFGWRYALGFVLLLFIHEMGHYIAARRLGMNVGLPTFIPFVGAWIELKDRPLSVQQEAHIAFAGPFAGTLAAAAVLALALHEHSTLLLALAYAGFFLNLFNLIPISPFDGGRIIAILSPKVWFVGLPGAGGRILVDTQPDVPDDPAVAGPHDLRGAQGGLARGSAGAQSALLRGPDGRARALRELLRIAAQFPVRDDL